MYTQDVVTNTTMMIENYKDKLTEKEYKKIADYCDKHSLIIADCYTDCVEVVHEDVPEQMFVVLIPRNRLFYNLNFKTNLDIVKCCEGDERQAGCYKCYKVVGNVNKGTLEL